MTPDTLLLIARLLLALALYSFLAFILWALRQDLREASTAVDRAPDAHLQILEGPDVGRCLPLDQTSEVGRIAGNVIQLADETVSARHARLSYHGGQWWLEDMASRNGTQLNDILVEEPLVVAYGDEIRFGRVLAKLAPGPAVDGTTMPVGGPASREEESARGGGEVARKGRSLEAHGEGKREQL